MQTQDSVDVILPRRPHTAILKRNKAVSGSVQIPENKTVSFMNYKSKNSKSVKYISQAYDDFGTSSPHWTIPSSRKDPPPPPDFPGPGQYQVPPAPISKILPHSIQLKEETDYSTITSNIEYTGSRVFPETRSRSISSISGKHFYDLPETPAPTYKPQDSKKKGIKIGSKYQEPKPNGIPGPADYKPKDPMRASTPVFTIPRERTRCFVDDVNDTPGPGAYDVTPRLRKAPRWTEKLRVLPQRYTRSRKEHERPWAVGRKDI